MLTCDVLPNIWPGQWKCSIWRWGKKDVWLNVCVNGRFCSVVCVLLMGKMWGKMSCVDVA